MQCHQHSTSNILLGKPVGWTDQECITVPATLLIADGQRTMIQTFWRPEPAELEALNKGGSVMLTIVDSQHPPVRVEVTLDK